MNQVIVCFIATLKSSVKKHLAKFSIYNGDIVYIDVDRATPIEARTIYSKLGLESLWHTENSLKPVSQSSHFVSSFTTALLGETKQSLINMYTSPCIEIIFLEGCRFWGHDTIFDANKTAQALPSSTIVFAAAMVSDQHFIDQSY